MAETATERRLERQRWRALEDLTTWLEPVMIVLGLAWLGLFFVELVWGLTRVLEIAVTAIWLIFILDFLVRLAIAPDRLRYAARNWLTVIALVIPALRVFRVFAALRALRLARAARSLRVVRVVTALNRATKSLAVTMGRRGLGYLAVLTVLVTLIGAAGMFAFEQEASDNFASYDEALWWTAMIITTLGSQGWPETLEGRILGFLLALYAFVVFGYVAGALASLLIERERGSRALAGELDELKTEVRALRSLLAGDPSRPEPPASESRTAPAPDAPG